MRVEPSPYSAKVRGVFAWWGRTVVRLRWLILTLAAGFLVLGATWGTGVFDVLAGSGFDDPGSESSRAAVRIEQELGRQNADVVVLYTTETSTVDDPAVRSELAATVARLRASPYVEYVGYTLDGLVSADRHTALVTLRLNGDIDLVRPLLPAEGLRTQVGGVVPFVRDAQHQIERDIVRAELLSLPILLVLLVFIFRGLVAATTPLIVGVVAILGGFVATRLIAGVTDVSTFAVNIITMLGLGMAIDYALFVVSRFREELAAGRDTAPAIAATLATAGRTVLVSGLTVALALASLLIFPMGFLRSMGWGGMAAVLVAMLAALTVLPALLAVLGHRVNAIGWRGKDRPAGHGLWARLALSVMRRPWWYALPVLAILGALAAPFLRAEFGGLDERVLPAGTESRVVAERIAAEFPGRSAQPITVLVSGSPSPDALVTRIRALPGVTGVQVTAVRGSSALLAVDYAGEPTSPAARDLVTRIRALDPPPGAEVLVGGRSASDLDQLASLGDRLLWMVPLVGLVTVVLLFLAFGSVVLPLKAVLMNAVSIGASFGVVVWVFQDGHLADLLDFTPTGYLEPTNLILMLAVLFGLSTDYEVFLLSRVREEWDHSADNTQAVAGGLQRTGGIITAAALLLIIVVGGFATGGTASIKMLGVGAVVAIAVDALLVRALLVPATMRLLGRWNWWAPGPLARVYRRYGFRETVGSPVSTPREPDPTRVL